MRIVLIKWKNKAECWKLVIQSEVPFRLSTASRRNELQHWLVSFLRLLKGTCVDAGWDMCIDINFDPDKSHKREIVHHGARKIRAERNWYLFFFSSLVDFGWLESMKDESRTKSCALEGQRIASGSVIHSSSAKQSKEVVGCIRTWTMWALAVSF